MKDTIKRMKILKWVLSFVVFNILFVIGSYLIDIFSSWLMQQGGWKYILIPLSVFIVFFISGSIITIVSLISPARYKAPIFYRWFCVIFFVIGVIYIGFKGFNMNGIEFSNTILLGSIAVVSSPKRLASFLKGVD